MELFGPEIAADFGSYAPHLEKTRGDPRNCELLRHGPRSLSRIFRVIAGNGLKSGIRTIPLFQADGGSETFRSLQFGIVLMQQHQAVAVWKRKRLEENCINSRKHRAVCPYGKSDGENDRKGERRG